ncbi:MAG: metallophosphoesterase family protein, partial [Kiritimatiellae bacterium]|nr:metallophosphoesterase family protein [Kiritimatiellia bacterium]
TDAVDARADKIICLGDVLGYGPDPVAALELVYRRAHVCLAGNHDDAVSRRFPVEDFTDFAAAAVARHRAALSQEAIDWLRRLPYTCEFDGFACVHGDFSDPKHFNYILEPQDAQPSWNERSEQLLFIGHTHQPGIFVIGASGIPHLLAGSDFTLEDGKRYIVNPGSVGYPRSGACRSSYCIYDDQSRTVFFRTLPFDLESYATKMHGQGLNEAPWMLARAAERRRPAVRGNAKFGRAGTTGVSPVAVAQERDPPTLGEAALLPLHDAKKVGFPRWAIALIALGVLALAAIVAYTLFILRSMPKDRASMADISVQEVSPPPPPAQPLTELKLSPPRDLADGWQVAFEVPDEQKVVVEYNAKKNAQVFRIEHAAPHVVRFTKRLSLRPRPDRLYWRVALADGKRGNAKVDFNFITHLVYSDENGVQVGREDGGGKLSENKKKGYPVPESAVDAVLSIDCFCTGAHELEMPFFASRPHH